MSDDGWSALLRRAARNAGRQIAEAKLAYRESRGASSLPEDDAGRARIVCRRHAEKRAVNLDENVPECYDPDHPDCRGCVEDIREGAIETW